jgi:hypothetical protein
MQGQRDQRILSGLTVEAAYTLVARLNAHWPRIGSNEINAQDWSRALRSLGVYAPEVVEEIVNNWTGPNPPTIGDLQATARRLALFRQLHDNCQVEREHEHAISPPRPDKIIAMKGLSMAREALERARNNAKTTT